MRYLLVFLSLGLILLGGPGSARADIVYLYDDLGRLVRVIRQDGEAATYHYDAVGNILQITRESGVAQTTSVTGTSRTMGDQGSTVPLTLTGSNLVGATVVCTTPGVTAQNVHSDFDQITLELVIAQSAPTGPIQCEVQGLNSVALAFSVTRTIPAFLGAPAVSVRVAEALGPFVATGASVQVTAPLLVVDRSVLGAVSIEVGPGTSEIAAAAVSVSLQPVVTSVSPATGAPATPSLVLRVLGAGLGGATDVRVLRNNATDSDITVVTFSVSSDGTELDLQIAIGPSAPLGARVIRITTPAGSSTADGTGGNLFTVQ